MATAFVGIGANLGDARATVLAAIERLAGLPGIRLEARSRLYRTRPHEAGGPDFVNAVVRLETLLAPHALLDALQAIEGEFGRERPYRNAPRTLDLDLLLYDQESIGDARLNVPHPRMAGRAFVLAPLADIAPQLRLPQGGTVAERLARVADDPSQAIEVID